MGYRFEQSGNFRYSSGQVKDWSVKAEHEDLEHKYFEIIVQQFMSNRSANFETWILE